jgi:hypothetical protein
MSMSLLEATVRSDWQAIDQERAHRNALLWRVSQLGVAGAALLILLLEPPIGHVVFPVAGAALLVLVLWLPPLWYIFGSRDRRQQILSTVWTSLLLVGSVVASYWPLLFRPAGRAVGMTILLIATSLALAAASWLLLLWILRNNPAQASKLGITSRDWRVNIAIGLAAGSALGFHLLLTGSMFPARHLMGTPVLAPTVWLLCYYLGPRLLGEELLFRGLGVALLSGPAGEHTVRITVRIALVNLYLYLVPIAWLQNAAQPATMSVQVWAWSLVYYALLALTTTALRIRQGSLVPGLACNVVFSLCMAVVLRS